MKLKNFQIHLFFIFQELELYKTELLDKPATLIVNKMDTPNAIEKYKEFEYQIKNLKGNSRATR